MRNIVAPSGPARPMSQNATLDAAVLAAAKALRPFGPVPVVFATGAFVPLLDNWLAHARRTGVNHSLVVALDRAVATHRVPDGVRVVPAAAPGSLAALWLLRLRIFALLAAHGIDFVHSDVDAVWLDDPRPACFADPGLDLVFSQGTYHPEAAYQAWGFVLCCGFFSARGTPAAMALFAAVRARAMSEHDDQAALNHVLIDGGTRWATPDRDTYRISFADRAFTACHEMSLSVGAPFGVRIGLLPYHLVPRLATAEPGALVRHPPLPRDIPSKIAVLKACNCWIAEPGERPQVLVFSYHKSGTTLFDRVMRKLADTLGLRLHLQYGMAREINADADIVLLPHALLGFQLARRFRGIRIIRDPRDIWVSGYLYHCHATEAWCTNTNFDPTPPIAYPRVDFSMQHRPERWKRRWLSRLNGRSYQQNLLERDQAAGLAFELDGYTGCTLEAMRAWRPLPEVLDVKLEELARNYDATMESVFRHLGFGPEECKAAAHLAASEDVGRMDDATLDADPHIHSRTLSKWPNILSDEQVNAFEKRYGDLLLGLGYELSRRPT